MDDKDKRYTIQVKGVAYKFAPLDLETIGRLQILPYMDVSDGVATKAIMRLLKDSLGKDAWDELSTRLVLGEVPLTELSSILDKLLKRTVKDAAKDPAPGDA